MTRRLRHLLATLGLIYLTYAVLMVWLHPRLIYPFYPEPFSLSGFEEVSVPVQGADHLPVFVFRAGKQAPTVLYFMGNVGSLSFFRAMLDHHRRAGRNVVAMTYRGGGGVPGEPSETALKRDALAVFDALPQLSESETVIVQGYSLGTGLAMHVAANRQVNGVILSAPYEKMCQLMTAASLLPACFLPWVQKWDNAALTQNLSEPVLVLHGNEDSLIPMVHGQRLSQSLQNASFVKIEGAGHTDLFATKSYLKEIDAFVGQSATR